MVFSPQIDPVSGWQWPRTGLVRLLLALFLLSPVVLDGQRRSRIPAERLVMPTTSRAFKISPDGVHLAWLQATPRGPLLLVGVIDRAKIVQTVPVPIPVVQDIHWSGDTRLVIEGMGNILAVNLDGTQRQVLEVSQARVALDTEGFDFRGWRVLDPLPREPREVLLEHRIETEKAHVYRVNVYTGERRLIIGDDLNVSQWYTDREGRVRLGLRQKEDRVEFFYRAHERRPWETFDAFVDNSEFDFEYGGGNYLTQRVFVLGFGYEPLNLYVSTDLKRDTKRVAIFDLLTKRIYRTIHLDDTYDIGDPNLNNTRLYFLDSEEKLVGIRYERDKPKVKWLDERFEEMQEKLDDRRPNFFNEVIDWNEDASAIVIRSWNDQDLGDILIYKPASDRLMPVLELSPQLKQLELSDTRSFLFRARDGMRIRGYINLPPGDSRGPHPTVLMPHGGPQQRDSWSFDPFVQYLAINGFAVLRVDFRGSAGYGREHLEAGIKEFGFGMIDDMVDAVDWAVQRRYTDTERVGVMGASYGGYAALQLAIRYPDRFQAIMPMLAPVELVSQIRFARDNDSLFAYQYWLSLIGDLRGEREILREVSPYNHVDKITVPVRAFFGEQDPIVPAQQGRLLDEALSQTSLDYEVTIFPEEGHGFENPRNLTRVMEESVEFFRQHLR